MSVRAAGRRKQQVGGTARRTGTAERLYALVGRVAGADLPLRLQAWDGTCAGPAGAPVVHVRSRRALRRLVWAPDELGLAQAYVTGEIDVPGGPAELRAGLRALWHLGTGRPRPTSGQLLRAAGLAARLGAIGPRPPAPAAQARLRGVLHSTARDRAAIAHHYDLSNEFYALLLDDSMAYSCGYYAEAGMDLAAAQKAKLDLICTTLQLRPGFRLLDVGCGWGSMIVHAAEHYGVTALGVTLSEQQRAFVERRIAERGLGDRVRVRVQDYRSLREPPFDAVSTIEMGEHVGDGNYPSYARTLHDQLRPGGALLLQQMSRRAGSAAGGGAFIEHFIAPDMHMRPLPETLGLLESAGFEIREVQALREHYVQTVADWSATLERHADEAVALVGEQVVRTWRLYLAGGGLAFEQGRMGVDQVLARRPQSAGSHAR